MKTYLVEIIQEGKEYDVSVKNSEDFMNDAADPKKNRLTTEGFASLGEVEHFLTNVELHENERFDDIRLFVHDEQYPTNSRWKDVYDNLKEIGRIN